MRNRVGVRWSGYAAAVATALLASGCALTTMVQVTPPVGTIGQPLTYTIKVTNPAACTLTSPELVLVPLIERNTEVDEFCAFAQSPALTLCNSVENPGDLPSEILAQCCMDATFQMSHQMLCTSGATTGPPETVGQQVQDVRSKHPFTTTATVTMPDNTQSAVTCSFNGEYFDCLLDDIAAGQTETVTLTVAPTLNGSFANIVLVEGNLPCVADQFPGGSACTDTLVGAAPAPALSDKGIAAGVILLVAIGGWRLRARHRRVV